jgi:hypothetical protein
MSPSRAVTELVIAGGGEDVRGLQGRLVVAAVVVLVEAQAAGGALRNAARVREQRLVGDGGRLVELVGRVPDRPLDQPAAADDAVVAQGLVVAAVFDLAEPALDVGVPGTPRRRRAGAC